MSGGLVSPSAGRVEMARCPGCGSMGDVVHLSTCCETRQRAAYHDGASFVIAMVGRMIERRRWVGSKEIDSLRAGVKYAPVPWRYRGPWWRIVGGGR